MSSPLSIIMPCYNCLATLQEAVDSCYTQGFSSDEFEIVMVDDGSTDGTAQLIRNIAATHSNIQTVFHTENKGGGAARNTAVSHSKYEYIFCLDSDDILPPDTLPTMLEHLTKHATDGVLFAETKFFTTSLHTTTSIPNIQPPDPIALKHLFENKYGYLTQVNFLYTKQSFLQTGGYPTSHGFDTQTFGLLFLSQGLKVSICPGTFYYHRQEQRGRKSYYQREYEQGFLSINTYLVLESIIDTLHPKIITLLIFFDIFTKNSHGDQAHLRSAISSAINSGTPLQKDTSQDSDTLTDTYIQMCKDIETRNLSHASLMLQRCIKITGKETALLQYMKLRIFYLQQGDSPVQAVKHVAKTLHKEGKLHYPKYSKIPRIIRQLRNIPKHIRHRLSA